MFQKKFDLRRFPVSWQLKIAEDLCQYCRTDLKRELSARGFTCEHSYAYPLEVSPNVKGLSKKLPEFILTGKVSDAIGTMVTIKPNKDQLGIMKLIVEDYSPIKTKIAKRFGIFFIVLFYILSIIIYPYWILALLAPFFPFLYMAVLPFHMGEKAGWKVSHGFFRNRITVNDRKTCERTEKEVSDRINAKLDDLLDKYDNNYEQEMGSQAKLTLNKRWTSNFESQVEDSPDKVRRSTTRQFEKKTPTSIYVVWFFIIFSAGSMIFTTIMLLVYRPDSGFGPYVPMYIFFTTSLLFLMIIRDLIVFFQYFTSFLLKIPGIRHSISSYFASCYPAGM